MCTKEYSNADIWFFVMTLAVFIVVPLMFYIIHGERKKGRKVKVPVVVRDHYNGTLNIIDTEGKESTEVIDKILRYLSYEATLVRLYSGNSNTGMVRDFHYHAQTGIMRALIYAGAPSEEVSKALEREVKRL